MSSLPSLTAIANGDSVDATPVDGNFDTLAAFVDAELINRDGSVAMAADLAMGSNNITGLATPSSDTDAATKGYVDGKTLTSLFTRTTNIAVTSSDSDVVTFETEADDDDGWWSSGTTFTCPATGWYTLSASVELSAASSASINVQFDPSWTSADVGLENSATAAGDRAGASLTSYIEAGDTLTVKWREVFSLGGTATIDNVRFMIQKVRV